MGKTNHRVNKERTEKLGEAEAHKKRRGAKQKTQLLVESYSYFDDADRLYDDLMANDELETFEKIRRRNG